MRRYAFPGIEPIRPMKSPMRLPAALDGNRDTEAEELRSWSSEVCTLGLSRGWRCYSKQIAMQL
jgi:hypothetical protein